MAHWMFECREVAKLVSRSMDAELSWRQRAGVRLHVMMCRLCARHKRQLELIRRFMEHYARHLQEAEPAAGLSNEAKARLKQSLRDAAGSSA